jgi:hypothetical protein
MELPENLMIGIVESERFRNLEERIYVVTCVANRV